MDDSDFELVDNARVGLASYSLERLKTIAPTFRERSAQRLACVELIAEKERELANLQMASVSRKASFALSLAMIAFLWPVIVLVGWIYFRPYFEPSAPVKNALPVIKKSTPIQTPTPENQEPEATPEPLPSSIGELPPTPVGG